MKEINVVLVGLGRVGSKFLQELQKVGQDKIHILAVCEANRQNPFVAELEAQGVPCFSGYEGAVHKLGEKIDIIIDTSNRPEVKQGIRSLLQETDNKHTVVVPMVVSYMMWYLLPNVEEIPQAHHHSIGY
jgi:predicted dinucleotide-utilizing enzyme